MEDQGHAAAVSQLVEDTADHIREIIDSAQTARWNKRECEHLVLRLSIIRELLPRLPQDSELESPLKELGKALGEAHELVLFGAGSQAESFRRVNGRINSLQSLFPVIIASRLGRILPLDDHDGESSITLTGPPPSSSYASLETQNADTMRKFGKILREARRDADLRPSFIASHHGDHDSESITLTGPPPSSSYGSPQTQPYEIGESSQPWEMINALLSCREMSDQAMELKVLKGVLIDANAEPIRLSYPFLSFITGNFSQEIGRGGFGSVYQGDIGTSKVAVKKLHISESFSDALFVDEIKCLIKAKHNNVVRFLGYCADTHGKLASFNGNHVMSELPHRLLCFEYVPNGDLQKYLKDKSHKDEWKIRYQMIRGICHGLSYLHGQRINHLDLKPANILLDACMEPKITDFGISRCFDEGVSRVYTKAVRGTMGCIAPETINNGEITFKSDIYGLGIIIIKLLTRCNYYDFENWHTSLDMDHPQVKSWAEIAQTCVQSDQHKRPAIREIMQKLDEIESM